jgi:hypothetical protein
MSLDTASDGMVLNAASLLVLRCNGSILIEPIYKAIFPLLTLSLVLQLRCTPLQ